ncbi:MAG: transposase [Thermoanaerobacteraceae bacterium]|nr:transposase [Thermoanaerobacteraceae bacterium]
MDLDPAIPLLSARLPGCGRPVEFDPVDLLRSLILMSDMKGFGITECVARLRSDRLLAVLSGFHPNHDYGIPFCPKGFPMVFWGFQKSRNRLKWRCPKMAGKKLVRSQVCCDQPCSPSAYGRTVYTKPHDDLRFFTPTPRGSAAWKSVYKLRSGSERSFSRKKKDYELKRCRVRSLKAWYWRTHFAAINQHLDAWVEQFKKQGFDIWAEVLVKAA